MSKETTRTNFLSGAFISQDTEDSSPPAVAARTLRRWSVAELIARAVPAPPADKHEPRLVASYCR